MSDIGIKTLEREQLVDTEVLHFSAAEDPKAAEQFAVTMGQGFASEPGNALYCPDPTQYERRWQIIASNCVLRNQQPRILYGIPVGPGKEEFAAAALSYLYPDEKAPETVGEVPPGIMDLSPLTRPETAPLRDSMFAFMDDKKAAFYEAHGTFQYILFIATRPEMQGRGYGSRLLRHLTDQADAAGRWCYLEATNDNNARLYERHGFQRLQGPQVWTLDSLPGKSMTLIPMARPPAAQAAAAAGAE